MKYLGIHVGEKIISCGDWKRDEEKIESKMCCCQGKQLSIGGRSILINSSLSSVPLCMFFYRVPVGAKKNMDNPRSRFL